MSGKYHYVYGTRVKDGKQVFLGPYSKFEAERVSEQLENDAQVISMNTKNYPVAKSRFKEGRFSKDGLDIDEALKPISSNM